MGQKRGRKKNNLFFSEHHLTPKSKGGRSKDKKKVVHTKHVAWHILVKDSLPDSASDKLSFWIPDDYRFFALNINNLYTGIKKINNWIQQRIKEDDFKVVIKIKQKSKIIRFQPYFTINKHHLSS